MFHGGAVRCPGCVSLCRYQIRGDIQLIDRDLVADFGLECNLNAPDQGGRGDRVISHVPIGRCEKRMGLEIKVQLDW